MKKILAMVLTLVMAVSLCACTAPQPAQSAAATPAAATAAPAEATEAPAAATEAPAAATEAPAATAIPVQRIIVWNNAIQGLTASDQPRSEGDLRSAYAIKDVYDKCSIKGNETVQVIGSDGYVGEEALKDLLQKYMTLKGENAPIVVGEAQDPDWAVWEVAYIKFGPDAIMTSYKDKLSVKDIFAALGMVEAENYDFICTDNYTQKVPASDIGDCYISWVGDRVDGVVPGIGSDTLYNILYIQPSA